MPDYVAQQNVTKTFCKRQCKTNVQHLIKVNQNLFIFLLLRYLFTTASQTFITQNADTRAFKLHYKNIFFLKKTRYKLFITKSNLAPSSNSGINSTITQSILHKLNFNTFHTLIIVAAAWLFLSNRVFSAAACFSQAIWQRSTISRRFDPSGISELRTMG